MKVIKYRLNWSMTQNRGSLEMHLEDNSTVILEAEEPGKLIVWVDLLRHDAPVYYWKTEQGEGLKSEWEKVIEPDESWRSPDHHQDGQS